MVISQHSTCRTLTPIVLLVLFTFLFTACAQRMRFQNSSEVPAASGVVKIKKDDNNNFKINLKVERLSPPDLLNPPKRTYVVWMETEQTGTVNVGSLSTSRGIFSKKLRSSLETVTPYKPIMFFITGEENRMTEFPQSQKVLRTKFYD